MFGVGKVRRFSTLDLIVRSTRRLISQQIVFEEILERLASIGRPPHGHHSVPINRVVLEAIKNRREGLPSLRVIVLVILLVALHALLQVTTRRPCAAIALPNFLPEAQLFLPLLYGFLVCFEKLISAIAAAELIV